MEDCIYFRGPAKDKALNTILRAIREARKEESRVGVIKEDFDQ